MDYHYLLAHIFTNNLEKKMFNSENQKILFGYRYVDDVFASFRGSDADLNEFLSCIIKFHTNIKFTLEKELNSTKEIERKNEELKLFMYKKNTHTDLTIKHFSFHRLSHKLAAYHLILHTQQLFSVTTEFKRN